MPQRDEPSAHFEPGDAPPNEKRVDAGGASVVPPAPREQVPHDRTLAIELEWLDNVYQGDHVKQATARAILMGSLLGGALSLQNLFVGLKTGWGLGVAITACILSFTIYSALVRIAPKVFGPPMSILENNAMQSTASSAGYSTGGVMTSAICAYLIVNKHHIGWFTLTLWTFFLAVLGTVMAIPMKRQMINIEKLKFPSGMAAAETLRSLHAEGDEASRGARALGWSGAAGSLIAWLRDAHATAAFKEHVAAGHARAVEWVMVKLTWLSRLPGMIEFPRKVPRSWAEVKLWWTNAVYENGYPTLLIAGKPAIGLTIAFEGSLIMIAAGALMGMRTTISMIVAATINYAYLAPKMLARGDIHELGYRAIVKWSLWPGAALMVTSGMLTFVLQWRTVARAFKGLGDVLPWNQARKRAAAERSPDAPVDPIAAAEARIAAVEVPPSWFLIGMAFSTLGLVLVGWFAFRIHPILGVVAVAMTFILSIVACRATGETDTTPIGAMGKITQLTYGLIAQGNVTTNLMAAGITAGAAGSAADLLTDLKSGYLLGANPRKQFLAQLAGTVVGTAVVVPMFYILVPTPEVLGSDKFPAPAAQVWAGVAQLLSQGVGRLEVSARWGMLIGGAIGLLLPTLELLFPKHKKWVPSSMGVGLALVIPWFNSYSMFLGAFAAYVWEKWRPKQAEKYVVAISSGVIAGESLMGVVVLLLGSVLGWLE